jgi:formamidopyrimidine-DNA glycosylase
MIELPEAVSLTAQINDTICGKTVASVTVEQTPHKLAWYYGDKLKYQELLYGKTIGKANAWGGMVELQVENVNVLFGEGVGIRFHGQNEPRPAKHQLLMEFDDQTAVSGAIQMYGGLGCFKEGELDNSYYKLAKEKPSPLGARFDKAYFNAIISPPEVQKSSLKAFLATEQRIPGLGNGVLQDILFKARMHPKKKVSTLSEAGKEVLFKAVKETLSDMTAKGGRDTEMDLFGRPGGYKTILCKNTVNKPCPVCGRLIKKEAYMGGSVYFCEKCQRGKEFDA